MDNFDEQVKKEIKKYLNKNINLSSDDKVKVQNAIHRKKRHHLMYYTTISLTAIVSLFLFMILMQGEDTSFKMTPSPFSHKSGLEKGVPDRDKKEEVDDSNEEMEDLQESVASEEIEDQPQNDFNSEETEAVENEVERKGEEDQQDTNEQIEQPEVDEEPVKESDETVEGEEPPDENIEENDPAPNIDESVFLNLMVKFSSMRDVVFADVDPEVYYEVAPGHKYKTLTSKEQVYALISDIMTRDLAEYFWKDSLFEDETGLYLIPMDGVSGWFEPSEPYQIKEVNNETYQLMQTIETGLYGKLNQTFTITRVKGNLLLSDFSATN